MRLLEKTMKRSLRYFCLFPLFAIFILRFLFLIPDRHVEHTVIKTSQVTTMEFRNQVTVETVNQGTDAYEMLENPSNYLQSARFDLIVKMVYAYFYVNEKIVPAVIKAAYAEHLRVWNKFKEYCSNNNKSWFDGKLPCKPKNNQFDFVSTFHETINNIKYKGFNSSISRIPLSKNGFLLNGAHRLSAAIIAGKDVKFEHHNNTENSLSWGYTFFKDKGVSEKMLDMVMLEWMRIQLKLPQLKKWVYIVSLFSNNRSKDEAARDIVKSSCSADNSILYKTEITFSKNGIRQLITHMYGERYWLETKIQRGLSKFETTVTPEFLFVYTNSSIDLVKCKTDVRQLYDDTFFKSTIHIPDTIDENLILAEMILNPNSVQFMNYAENASDCKCIAKEIASRASIKPIKTIPNVYVGRHDIMVDSGTVLGLFGLRKRTDVDLLFLHNIDTSILGNRNGFAIQAHAFKINSISKERAWGEDHFNSNGPRNQFDLFYDPENFGYCYGIKFVSLKQLVRYKQKRKEPGKDDHDVELIYKFLDTTVIPN